MKFRFVLAFAMIVAFRAFVSETHAIAGDSISPGAQITLRNWQQYRGFMPDGMIALFAGSYFWTMPVDLEIDVGPTLIHSLPRGYLDATEKYASQVKLMQLPGGALTIDGYVAGIPFPNPDGANKGWEIFANTWYRYTPYLTVSTSENPVTFCTRDRYGSNSCERFISVDRWLSRVTDPAAPLASHAVADRDETRFSMVVEPEQRKYTSALTVYYSDLKRMPAVYVFTPADRRVTQLSSAARCARSGGTDLMQDDLRYGFAGNITEFSARYLNQRKILALLDYQMPGGTFPVDYDMPLGFPKPSWGKWQVRDTYAIDVRRLPSLAAGYCYGKRIMYIDQQFYSPLWMDLYDNELKLWKVAHLSPQALDIPGIGAVNNTGSVSEQFWDLLNSHATYITTFVNGHTVYIDQQVPGAYDDVSKYSSATGLSEVMR